MRVVEIVEDKFCIYNVTLKPNWLERLFGCKTKTIQIKDTRSQYTFGGGNVYVDKNGDKLGNGSYIGEKIDSWKLKF